MAGSPTAGRAGSRRSDRGSVTAETALAVPALLVVLALALWTVAAVGAQLRAADAAAGAARAAARGEAPGVVSALATRLAPDGATVRVWREGDEVHVAVSAAVGAPGVVVLPPLAVEARAVAVVEPGAR